MNTTRVIGVVATGLALAACSSWSPSLDMFSTKPTTVMLTIESDPPGAEARTSLGGLCRTPCTQQVPVANEFTVSYALNGYTPQSVTVRPAASGSTVEPNPVLASLQSAAPPPKAPPKKRKRPAAKPAPATAEAPPAAEAPAPSMGNIAPPPGAFTPPPR
jgi:hypothetical protein